MDKNSIMLLLKAGQNKIIPSKLLISPKGCGFFPISEKVDLIQTSGLKWNMGNRDCQVKSLDWREFVSSSNEITDAEVDVKVSHDVIFVASIKNEFSH